MTNPDDNYKTNRTSNASNNSKVPSRYFGFKFRLSRWMRSGRMVIVCVLLAVMLWGLADSGNADSASKEDKQTTQVEKKSSKSNKSETAKSENQKRRDKEGDKKEAAENNTKSSESESAGDSAEEELVDKLLDKMLKAAQENVGSEEIEKITKQLDEAVQKLEKEQTKGAKAKKVKATKSVKSKNNNGQKGKSLKNDITRKLKNRNRIIKKKNVSSSKTVSSKPVEKNNKPKVILPGPPKPDKATKVSRDTKKEDKDIRAKSPEKLQTKPSAAKSKKNEVTENKVTESQASPSDAKAKIALSAQTGDPNALLLKPVLRPDDIVEPITSEGIVDIDMLIQYIGKEFKLNFVYADGVKVVGKVRLEQYGEIRRRDLLPLLESVLRFTGYTMVREGPFIRVVNYKGLHQKVAVQLTEGPEGPPPAPGDSVVSHIVEIRYISPAVAEEFMKKFTDSASFVDIPNSNKIIITEYARRLSRILEMLALIDKPGEPRRLEIVKPEYLDSQEAIMPVRELMNALNADSLSQVKTKKAPTPSKSSKGKEQPPGGPGRATVASSKEKTGNIYTQIDKRTNRIILIGTSDQISQFKDLLVLFDVPQPGPKIELTIIPIENLPAKEVVEPLKSLIDALSSPAAATQAKTPPKKSPKETTPRRSTRVRSRAPAGRSPTSTPTSMKKNSKAPYMLIDGRLNRLFVIGSQEQITQVKDLLVLLDVPKGGAEIMVKTVTVEYVDVDEVMSQVRDLLKAITEQQEGTTPSTKEPARKTASKKTTTTRTRTSSRTRGRPESTSPETSGLIGAKGPYLMADKRTVRLFFVGTEDQFAQVKDLLVLLDVPRGGPEIIVKTIDIRYVEVTEVTSQVGELLKAITEQEEETQATVSTGKRGPERTVRTAPGREDSASRRRGSTRRDSRQTSVGGLASPKGPYLMGDERTARMFLVGTEEQYARVMDLLSLLDVEAPGAEIRLETVPLSFLPAETAAEQISTLMEALYGEEDDKTSSRSSSESRRSRSASEPTDGRSTVRERIDRARSSDRGERKSRFRKTSEEGPFLLADNRIHRLLVIGNNDQIEQVKELLKVIDLDIGIKLVPIQIKKVFAADIAEQLSELIKALTEDSSGSATTVDVGRSRRAGTSERSRGSQRRVSQSRGSSTGLIETGLKGPLLLPDERTNRLLIVGTDKHVKMVMELLPVLDVEPSAYHKMVLKIYQPQYVEAAEVLKIMDSLGITKKETEEMRPRERARRAGEGVEAEMPQRLRRPPAEEGEGFISLEEPELRVAVQESTNKIFVYATEYQLRDIEEIMKHIDLDPNEALGAIQIYFLENREPEVVAGMLQDLLESEKTIKGGDEGATTHIPGKENAPIVVPLDDIYAVAVRGSSKQHKEIKDIIKLLDKRLPQVLVEAIMVQVNESEGLSLGVSMKEGWNVGGTRGGGREMSGTSPFGFNPVLSETGIVTGTGATLAFFNEDFVYASLEALQDAGNGKIFSMPRIMVKDNETGTITSKRQEPTTEITTQPGSDTTVETFKGYEEAGTTLDITPHISEGEFLQLEITLTVDAFDGKSQGSIPPPKTNNEVKTLVSVPDNMYIVLGGLTTKNDSTTVSKVPILSEIPILGALFRKVTRSGLEGVLYVFVRAQIIRSEGKDGSADFQDLKRISQKNRIKLEKMETDYQQQPVIPGIKEKKPKDRTKIFEDN